MTTVLKYKTMKIRDSLNSAVLQKRFPEVYREFFSNCQIVVSAPHFFTWAGEYVGYWGGLMMLQKLPLRLYVGIEFMPLATQPAIQIATESRSYSLQENKFKKDTPDQLAQARLLNFINTTFKHKFQKKPIKIHLLSEMPFGGSGSSGALAACLANALALASQLLTAKDIQEWTKQPSLVLIKNKKYRFDFVFRLAWEMLAAYQGDLTSGATIFAALLDSPYPLYYVLKKDKNLILPLKPRSESPSALLQGKPEPPFSLIDQAEFSGGRLNELFNLPTHGSWPIDFGLLYLGEPRGHTPFSTSPLEDNIKDLTKFFQNNFPQAALGQNQQMWQENCLEVMNFLSGDVLLKLGQLLSGGRRHDVLREFLRAVDRHQALFLLLGTSSNTSEAVNSVIHHQASKIDDLGAGVKAVSTTKKNIILFVFPAGQMRQTLSDILLLTKKEFSASAVLGYASWLDGLEQQGVKVEQALKQKIYSPFVSQNTILAKEYANRQTTTLTFSAEQFTREITKADLALIEKTGRVLVKGQPLNSQELHSQKTAIKILKILLNKLDQEISNQDLPPSSYANDRYELQGKIVSPLIKVIEQKTKKKLNLTIRGSIGQFYLKLSPSNLRIWLVK